jgi:hypothetical protein
MMQVRACVLFGVPSLGVVLNGKAGPSLGSVLRLEERHVRRRDSVQPDLEHRVGMVLP